MVHCDEEIQHLRQILDFESYHVGGSDIPISGNLCRAVGRLAGHLAVWGRGSKQSKTIQYPPLLQYCMYIHVQIGTSYPGGFSCIYEALGQTRANR